MPKVEFDGVEATVLVGTFGGATSPTRHDTPLVGTDLVVRGPGALPLRPDFEYGVMVVEGEVLVDGQPLTPGHLGYIGLGRESVDLAPQGRARLLLLGGEPFESRLFMWWNFVGRSKEEIDSAYGDWVDADERFGEVRSTLPRILPDEPWWQSGLR